MEDKNMQKKNGKKITKTIATYSYTFKMCNKSTNKVKDVVLTSYQEAKNPTQLRAIFDSSSLSRSNYFICGEYSGVTFDMYAMSVEDFVKTGVKVDPKDDNDKEDKKDGNK